MVNIGSMISELFSQSEPDDLFQWPPKDADMDWFRYREAIDRRRKGNWNDISDLIEEEKKS